MMPELRIDWRGSRERQSRACRVLDARRPKSVQQEPPVASRMAQERPRPWPGTLAGLGAALLLAAD